jgi:hypothetical protein
LNPFQPIITRKLMRSSLPKPKRARKVARQPLSNLLPQTQWKTLLSTKRKEKEMEPDNQ